MPQPVERYLPGAVKPYLTGLQASCRSHIPLSAINVSPQLPEVPSWEGPSARRHSHPAGLYSPTVSDRPGAAPAASTYMHTKSSFQLGRAQHYGTMKRSSSQKPQRPLILTINFYFIV